MKLGIVVGTRPEIIKMSPIIHHCLSHKINFEIIHTQQHYSSTMDRIIFEDIDIDYPKTILGIKSKSNHLQISEIIEKCGNIFSKTKFDFVLVQGDTNTVLGAAIAANKSGTLLGHVEAGLRSFDRTMPEEINRMLTDDLSDFCFCPTQTSKNNLLNEGIDEKRLFIVGNTIVDSLYRYRKSYESSKIVSKLGLNKRFALVTLHRPANVDNPKNLKTILDILSDISKRFDYQVVFPVHPRTKNRIDEEKIQVDNITILEPQGFFDFLALINSASLILTDSGGIQEEACVLHKPCITLRENTERPETIETGANILTGLDSGKIIQAVTLWQNKSLKWEVPIGDGTSSEQIINILLNNN